jgi:hypothetical protein
VASESSESMSSHYDGACEKVAEPPLLLFVVKCLRYTSKHREPESFGSGPFISGLGRSHNVCKLVEVMWLHFNHAPTIDESSVRSRK